MLLVMTVVLAALSLEACAGRNPRTIEIRFVSTAAADAELLGRLTERFEEAIPNHEFHIAAVATEAEILSLFAAGEVHIGLVSGQGVAELAEEHGGIAEPILARSEDALDVQTLSAEEQISAMNAADYRAQSLQGFGTIRNYAAVIVRTETYQSSAADNIDAVSDLGGKSVCTQSPTSPAGYVYPAELLDRQGLTLVSAGDPDADEVLAVRSGAGFPGAVTGLMEGDCDAAFIYQDARDNVTLLFAYPTLFADTRVVALSAPIMTETVIVAAGIRPALKIAIREAVIAISGDADADASGVFGEGAYVPVTNIDYAGERLVYLFRKNRLSV